MKKKLFAGALVGLMSMPLVVNAAGVSTVKFEGNTSVNTGDEFKVNMVLDNIDGTNGGIVAFGGYISYDKNVLELVSTEKGDAYDVIINENINKIAALDYTLSNGITERTNVYTLTFKAINEGNTSVTLTNGEVDDIGGTVSFNVEELNVNTKNAVVNEPVNVVNNETATYTYQDEVKVEKDEKIESIKNIVNKFFNKR